MSAAGESRRAVEVAVGEYLFALPLSAIREILPLVALTSLPAGAPAMRGAMNFHGVMVPVLDLRILLGSEAVDRSDTPILLLAHEEDSLGVIADEVHEVVEVEIARVQPRRDRDPLPSFVIGVVAGERGMTYLVDPELLIEELGT